MSCHNIKHSYQQKKVIVKIILDNKALPECKKTYLVLENSKLIRLSTVVLAGLRKYSINSCNCILTSVCLCTSMTSTSCSDPENQLSNLNIKYYISVIIIITMSQAPLHIFKEYPLHNMENITLYTKFTFKEHLPT